MQPAAMKTNYLTVYTDRLSSRHRQWCLARCAEHGISTIWCIIHWKNANPTVMCLFSSFLDLMIWNPYCPWTSYITCSSCGSPSNSEVKCVCCNPNQERGLRFLILTVKCKVHQFKTVLNCNAFIPKCRAGMVGNAPTNWKVKDTPSEHFMELRTVHSVV